MMIFGVHLFQKLSRLLSTQILGTGMAFFAHLILIQNLSSEEYGVFSFVFSLTTLVCIAGNFGFQASSVRIMPQLSKAAHRSFLFQSSLFVFILATLLSLLIFGIIRIVTNVEEYSHSALLLGAIMVPFLAVLKLLSGIFKGLQKGAWAITYESSFKELLFCFGLILFFIVFGLSANAVNSLFMLAIIFCVLSIVAYMHILRPLPIGQKTDKQALAGWLKISYPMMFVIAAQMLIHRSDIVMLGLLLDPGDVGVYGAAAKIAQAATFGLIAMNIIFSPLASQYFHAQKFADLKSLYIKTGAAQLMITLLLGALVVGFSPMLFSFFDPAYQVGLPVLTWLIVGYSLNCLWGPIPFLMIMTKYEQQAMWITFSAMILNIILNIFFIQQFGIIGAAFATIITLNLRNMMCLAFVIKKGLFKGGNHAAA